MEKTKALSLVLKKKRTKQVRVEARIGHVFINKKLFIFLNAATQESHKVSVLQFSYEDYFILELLYTLTRCFREPLDCNFCSIYQITLKEMFGKKKKKNKKNIWKLRVIAKVHMLACTFSSKIPCKQVQIHLLLICMTLRSYQYSVESKLKGLWEGLDSVNHPFEHGHEKLQEWPLIAVHLLRKLL